MKNVKTVEKDESYRTRWLDGTEKSENFVKGKNWEGICIYTYINFDLFSTFVCILVASLMIKANFLDAKIEINPTSFLC